jgi:hypothetical protein
MNPETVLMDSNIVVYLDMLNSLSEHSMPHGMFLPAHILHLSICASVFLILTEKGIF